MTSMEMRLRFQELALESNNGDIDKNFYIDSTSIMKYLNEAIVKFINDKFLSAGSFYERTKIIGNNLNDLKNLIKIVDLDESTVSAYYNNTLLFKSSDTDIWHYLGASGKLTRTYPYITNDTLIDLIAIDSADVNKYLTTSINKPIILVPVFTQTRSQADDSIDNQLSLLVIYDSYTTFTTDIVRARCLVKPKKLVLTPTLPDETDICELADYLHEDIVRLAVQLYTTERYKITSKGENK